MYMYHACRTRGGRKGYKGRLKRTHFKVDGRENEYIKTQSHVIT